MNADWIAIPLIAVGAIFFLAAALGLIRFPDTYSRLHAVAKADTVGLAFMTAGLVVASGSVAMGIRLVLVWILVMASSATTSTMIAGAVRRARARGDAG